MIGGWSRQIEESGQGVALCAAGPWVGEEDGRPMDEIKVHMQGWEAAQMDNRIIDTKINCADTAVPKSYTCSRQQFGVQYNPW